MAPELLEHVSEWEACLDEFARILKPNGILFLSTTNKLCPSQSEFNLPFYSWYPVFAKRYCERLALTSRPQIANYATYPAVNWFSFYSLKKLLLSRGFHSMDRFDIAALTKSGRTARVIISLIRKFSLVVREEPAGC